MSEGSVEEGVGAPSRRKGEAVYLHLDDVALREPGEVSIPSPRTAQRQAAELRYLRGVVRELEARVGVGEEVGGGEEGAERGGAPGDREMDPAWFYGLNESPAVPEERKAGAGDEEEEWAEEWEEEEEDGVGREGGREGGREVGVREMGPVGRIRAPSVASTMGSARMAPAASLARRPDTAEVTQLSADELFLKKVELNLAKVVAGRKPVVLVATGAFNPVHLYHTRMFYLARLHLESKTEFQVVGGVLSPRHDAAVLHSLRRFPNQAIPIRHRLAMCELAVAGSRWLSVSRWEGTRKQPLEYPSVLRHVERQLHMAFGQQSPTVMFLCGADELLRTGPETIKTNGVVCCARPGFTEELERQVGRRYRLLVHLVLDDELLSTSMDSVSSTKVRRRLIANRTVTDLVGKHVASYIHSTAIGEKIAGTTPWSKKDKEKLTYSVGGTILKEISDAVSQHLRSSSSQHSSQFLHAASSPPLPPFPVSRSSSLSSLHPHHHLAHLKPPHSIPASLSNPSTPNLTPIPTVERATEATGTPGRGGGSGEGVGVAGMERRGRESGVETSSIHSPPLHGADRTRRKSGPPHPYVRDIQALPPPSTSHLKKGSGIGGGKRVGSGGKRVGASRTVVGVRVPSVSRSKVSGQDSTFYDTSAHRIHHPSHSSAVASHHTPSSTHHKPSASSPPYPSSTSSSTPSPLPGGSHRLRSSPMASGGVKGRRSGGGRSRGAGMERDMGASLSAPLLPPYRPPPSDYHTHSTAQLTAPTVDPFAYLHQASASSTSASSSTSYLPHPAPTSHRRKHSHTSSTSSSSHHHHRHHFPAPSSPPLSSKSSTTSSPPRHLPTTSPRSHLPPSNTSSRGASAGIRGPKRRERTSRGRTRTLSAGPTSSSSSSSIAKTGSAIVNGMRRG